MTAPAPALAPNMKNSLGLPLDDFSACDVPPSVVVWGKAGLGKSYEMARAFPSVLYVQTSPDILRAAEDYHRRYPEQFPRVPGCVCHNDVGGRLTLDERTVLQYYGGSYVRAVGTIITNFVNSADRGTLEFTGIVFDEWSTLCERIFAELKLDPWGKYRARKDPSQINIFAVMDAFKEFHRAVLAVPRRTRRMAGFVSHIQEPRYYDDVNDQHNYGKLKTPAGPKMPVGVGDQLMVLCADASMVLEMVAVAPKKQEATLNLNFGAQQQPANGAPKAAAEIPKSTFSLFGTQESKPTPPPAPEQAPAAAQAQEEVDPTWPRALYTSSQDDRIRKVRGFGIPPVYEIKLGQRGLKELLDAAGMKPDPVWVQWEQLKAKAAR